MMVFMKEIKFGTDGWRAIIDREFTARNVARVIQAFCAMQKTASNRLVYVGYDRRRKSAEMARLAAQVLAANSFETRLSQGFCPTPCVSWLVKSQQALAGIVVTASHNPPQWNGIKFKDSFGSAASPAYTARIEEQILEHDDLGLKPVKIDFNAGLSQAKISFFDPDQTYVQHLKNFVETTAIKKAHLNMVVDSLYGAGTGFVQKVLDQSVIEIHAEQDDNFGGLNPEPIEKNLTELKQAVLNHQADIGLATDGDADRIGAVDERGRYVNSQQIFSLLLEHNITHRKLSGAIVKSVSTTELINKICERHALKLIETPIGFRHISQELIKHNALMGGEESGGISLREHVHERDGVLNGLLLLEMIAVRRKSLSELIVELDRQYGMYRYQRHDYHVSRDRINTVMEALQKEQIKEVSGTKVKCYNHLDGGKLIFEDGSWLLLRASGTEPLLRVYAEGRSEKQVDDLLHFAREYFKLGQ